MTQQLMDLKKWRTLEEGSIAHFHKANPRTVRVDVNSPYRVTLWIAEPGEDASFLALVEGRDRLEFSVDGPFDLTVDGGALSFYTVDGLDFSMEAVDDQSFTRLVEKRRRNPEMEYMMRLMYNNVERRMAQSLHEQEVRLERKYKKQAQVVDGGAASSARSSDNVAGKATASSNEAKKADATRQSSGKSAEDTAAVEKGATASKP